LASVLALSAEGSAPLMLPIQMKEAASVFQKFRASSIFLGGIFVGGCYGNDYLTGRRLHSSFN
jgi:hypothetical protein